MPTENKPVEPGPSFNTPDAGRTYIADLFKTVLKRHDYRKYIHERLAGDFACTLAEHFEVIKVREAALQADLTARDQRVDELEQQLRALLAAPACAHAWTDDGMFTLLCTKCGETEQDLNSPEDEPAAPVAGEEWRMNPCKQGHRDVGAAGGVASCYQCDEKITARTTEEAFALWNSSHPKACCGSCPAGCTIGVKP